MNLLVTGASGFIGNSLVEFLAGRGHRGVATGRMPLRRMPAQWKSFRRQDFLASERPVDGFDAVVHLEVKQHIARPTAADLAEFRSVNVGGTLQWLAWAADNEVDRFVLASTVKAARGGDGRVEELADAESDDPYGASKAEAERALRQWVAASPARCGIILRFAPVYGPGNQANLAAFARQVIKGRPCLVAGGRARKSLLSRSNAVAAIDHILRFPTSGCEVFNVADQEILTLAELAGLIAQASGASRPRSIPWFAAAGLARLGDAFEHFTGREFVLDSRRLKALTADAIYPIEKLLKTGFVPTVNTRDGIVEMAKWAGTQAG